MVHQYSDENPFEKAGSLNLMISTGSSSNFQKQPGQKARKNAIHSILGKFIVKYLMSDYVFTAAFLCLMHVRCIGASVVDSVHIKTSHLRTDVSSIKSQTVYLRLGTRLMLYSLPKHELISFWGAHPVLFSAVSQNGHQSN